MRIAIKGDTMIEVLFAITVFSLVSVLSIIVMNAGLATAESTLEISMARNEIDSQAEILRFIHNSVASEHGIAYDEGNRVDKNRYRSVWGRISTYAKENTITSAKSEDDIVLPISVDNCNERYDKNNSQNSIFGRRTMALNTHKKIPEQSHNDVDITGSIISPSENETSNKFFPTSLYPRIIYSDSNDASDTTDRKLYDNNSFSNTMSRVEGLWIIPVAHKVKRTGDNPEFYDFHIYTCWNAPGREKPTTIGTIVRLYNPDYMEN